MRYTGHVIGVWLDGSGLLLTRASNDDPEEFRFDPPLDERDIPPPGADVQVDIGDDRLPVLVAPGTALTYPVDVPVANRSAYR